MGQGSPDPVCPYHAHWATCVVGDPARPFFLGREGIVYGVTVVWGVRCGGHPPPDPDDPTRHAPSRTPPISRHAGRRDECGEREGGAGGEQLAIGGTHGF